MTAVWKTWAISGRPRCSPAMCSKFIRRVVAGMEPPNRSLDAKRTCSPRKIRLVSYKYNSNCDESMSLVMNARPPCDRFAYRLLAVVDAHKILGMEAGRIFEQGTHAEWMALGGRYAAMCALRQGAKGETFQDVVGCSL